MLLSRRVLVTAVLCLALLASASVAGAGVTILSLDVCHFYGSMSDGYLGHFMDWSGIGFHQDSYAGHYDVYDNGYHGQRWFEGGYSANVQTYVSSHRIGVSKSSHYFMYTDWENHPGGSAITGNFRMHVKLEVTRPWLATMWYDYGSMYGGMVFRNLDTGQWPALSPNGPPVLLDPGTYGFIAEGYHEHYGLPGNACGGGIWDGGIEFADPIPEPAYLSFVALAIFGLAAWRKRAKRVSV